MNYKNIENYFLDTEETKKNIKFFYEIENTSNKIQIENSLKASKLSKATEFNCNNLLNYKINSIFFDTIINRPFYIDTFIVDTFNSELLKLFVIDYINPIALKINVCKDKESFFRKNKNYIVLAINIKKATLLHQNKAISNCYEEIGVLKTLLKYNLLNQFKFKFNFINNFNARTLPLVLNLNPSEFLITTIIEIEGLIYEQS